MDDLLKSQMLMDDLAMAIAEENYEKALKYYEEYVATNEKITKKKFPKTFDEIKNMRKSKKEEQENLELESER